MKLSHLARRTPQARALWSALSLVLAMTLISACATQRQVADIVNESNLALLAAQSESNLALLAAQNGASAELDPDPSSSAIATSAAQKIDTFIAAHPDQKVTRSALRVRQGIVYLSAGSYNLAEAALNDAKLDDLKTDRDRALKELQPHLIWWYRVSRSAQGRILTESEITSANAAMSALREQVQKLQASPGIRDYLAEMRAWIGLKLAEAAPDRSTLKQRLEEAINDYSVIFTENDVSFLEQPEEALQDQAISVEGRRRLRARAVIAKAKEYARPDRLDAEHKPRFTNATFQRLISP